MSQPRSTSIRTHRVGRANGAVPASPAPATPPAQPSSAAAPTTLAAALGAFTEESVNTVSDVKAKATLLSVYAFVSGVAGVLLDTSAGSDTVHLQQDLAQVSITLTSVGAMAQAGGTVVSQLADRDAKGNAYHIAVSRAQSGLDGLAAQLGAIGHLLRGALGPKNPSLTQFGVKPLTPGRRAKKAPAATASAPTAAPAAATGTK